MRRWWSTALLLLLLLTVAGVPSAAASPSAAPPPAAAAPPAAAPSPSPSAAPAAAPAPGPVVVVGIPDLRWQDLDPTTTPTLWNLAQRSSVGALTVNSGQGVARRADGWLTLNTGSRALARVPADGLPDPGDPGRLWDLRVDNLTARYAAQVGALGDALRGAGLTTAAVGGAGAVLGAMASNGRVGMQAATVAEALPRADVAVVELPELYGVDRLDPDAVHAARTLVDERMARVLAELPAGASLLVAGVSDPAVGPARLHVAMASGPTFGHGLLTSASTGRNGVVQLIDVAPTVLWLRGVPAPASMLGVHWVSVPGAAGSTAEQVSGFVDLDERSMTVLAVVSAWYYWAVIGVGVLYVLITLVAWARRRTGFLRPLGAVVAAVPIATYLLQLVPWWRAGTWTLAPLTLAFAGLIGGFAAVLPWARRGRWRTAGIVAGLTAGIVTVDAATGSALSLDAPFADNPIIAGRFHGIGNVAFALLGTGTLVLAAALAGRLPARRAGVAIAGLGLLAVVVDGHPSLGDDFGGVLALLPAVAVLALAVSRISISWRHVAAVVAATLAVTGGFALYDFSRPAAERTHLGRFVAQLADGSAETVVLRKLATSLGSLTGGYGRYLVLGWLLLAVGAYLAHRRGRLRVPEGNERRLLGALLAALATLGLLGAALNDSGLEVPAFSLYLAVPLLVPLLVPTPRPSAAPQQRAGLRERSDGRTPLPTP